MNVSRTNAINDLNQAVTVEGIDITGPPHADTDQRLLARRHVQALLLPTRRSGRLDRVGSFPNKADDNARVAINVMASYLVGDDPQRSWTKVEEVQAQEHGTYRLLQGFITLTGMLFQELEFSIKPPISPEAMLKKLTDYLDEHPDND
ncbi:hypothetical protein [Mycolicibacter longobardus]|uniref:Uncharacterized protein n=1 Tax=Mycolicibacter longobardus TaxID=1108812 RepID=A0A1X1YPF1_9MYCO|nr:hypothetical protein [Mycolicibacter longobardus]MCV7384405.1 hypothetical protein [Mycolicibacter longobardus]ORW12881.1 hypothetical protein AWC16_06980 [Mycolicibacter longobardus]